MTETLQKQLNGLTLNYTTSEEEINGKKLVLVSFPTLMKHEVWGLVNPDTLKLHKGLGKSSYKEKYFAATSLYDLEAQAKKDMEEISKQFPTYAKIKNIKNEFLLFMYL